MMVTGSNDGHCQLSSVFLLRPELRYDRHKRDVPIHQGYIVPDVESQVLTQNILCLCVVIVLVVRALACLNDSHSSYPGESLSPWQF